MKHLFSFDLFNLEITSTGTRFALLEIATSNRCGALVALEINSKDSPLGTLMEISGDLLWFSLFGFSNGGAS